ncbi:MAG TPA: ribosome-associated translation inhibitor RaiA [Burkholderiaceae bacterium]|nr:ribosome-associated translation inhibitor RaiA [Burkholderiaceae bacterium]
MNLTISGRHIDVTPAIRDYVISKLSRIERHFDKVIDAQVIVAVERLNHIAEITLRVQGKSIHCSAVNENLYGAIDLLADKIDRQIIKVKTKAQNHAHESVKRQPVVAEPAV